MNVLKLQPSAPKEIEEEKLVAKLDLLSAEARKVITTHTGFRCEECTDYDYHEPLEVLNYEVNELGNNDIPDTIDYLYNQHLDSVNEIDAFIKRQFRTDNYELIWVASDPVDAIEFYGEDHKRYSNLASAIDGDGLIPVTKYSWQNNVLLISDCGIDGQLLAYVNGLQSETINQWSNNKLEKINN